MKRLGVMRRHWIIPCLVLLLAVASMLSARTAPLDPGLYHDPLVEGGAADHAAPAAQDVPDFHCHPGFDCIELTALLWGGVDTPPGPAAYLLRDMWPARLASHLVAPLPPPPRTTPDRNSEPTQTSIQIHGLGEYRT